ncbi:hypothetical protein ELI00_37045 [Rhizobium ruizarguesonis]|uniref:hypothetical protein n=1 Tax=Rhizobium ruizarguesonis TaxID=2081791 RepID=UPI00102F473E|nr:hypothetical protein [Rhizobium ruizarguesonis]TAX63555.1 hypothetical protein ELI00_37045 [Rhizobium ruizarguesonis]
MAFAHRQRHQDHPRQSKTADEKQANGGGEIDVITSADGFSMLAITQKLNGMASCPGRKLEVQAFE